MPQLVMGKGYHLCTYNRRVQLFKPARRWYSRKLVGYCLHHGLETVGCAEALEMALDSFPDKKSAVDLIHQIVAFSIFRKNMASYYWQQALL